MKNPKMTKEMITDMPVELYDYQREAVNNMKNGCILCGGVGSGKSRTALAYYFGSVCGGVYFPAYKWMKQPKNLYIITTARKRDTLEWEKELILFGLSTKQEDCFKKDVSVVVDSWNNIKKYVGVTNAFFIFDEQRVVGRGAWVRTFLKIVKFNQWILLSATPGDTWMDYIPVFIANGFYRNRSEFINQHVVYKRYSKFPTIDRYLNTGRLIRLRNNILIDMDYRKKTVAHHEDVWVGYDKVSYRRITRDRWNIFDNTPIVNATEYCLALRQLVNTDISRQNNLMFLVSQHPKAIIFYSFDYELDLLKELFKTQKDITVSEWNGHKHQPIPDTEKWVYLVQYTAGNEGWNCVKTDTIIFYSQQYSYKVLAQASGRIDRLNTPYKDLYYYHLKSRSGIDLAISKALTNKKKFNESRFMRGQ